MGNKNNLYQRESLQNIKIRLNLRFKLRNESNAKLN